MGLNIWGKFEEQNGWNPKALNDQPFQGEHWLDVPDQAFDDMHRKMLVGNAPNALGRSLDEWNREADRRNRLRTEKYRSEGAAYLANKDPNAPVDYDNRPQPPAQPYGGAGGGGGVAQQWITYAPPVATSAPPVPTPTAPSTPARDPKWDELYKTLLERAQQGLTIDRKDPIIRGQADAFAAQQERARRNYLGDVAEAQGPLANLQGERRMASERAGIATSGFESELLGRELQARRSEIATSLTEMRHMLTADQQLALQRELALIDDATKRYGIASEDATRRLGINTDADLRRMAIQAELDQYLGDLGFRQSESDRSWDWRWRGGDE